MARAPGHITTIRPSRPGGVPRRGPIRLLAAHSRGRRALPAPQAWLALGTDRPASPARSVVPALRRGRPRAADHRPRSHGRIRPEDGTGTDDRGARLRVIP